MSSGASTIHTSANDFSFASSKRKVRKIIRVSSPTKIKLQFAASLATSPLLPVFYPRMRVKMKRGYNQLLVFRIKNYNISRGVEVYSDLSWNMTLI